MNSSGNTLISGQWWADETPDHVVTGELDLSSGRVQLKTFDCLLALEHSNHSFHTFTNVTLPVVHGRSYADGEEFTLFEVSGLTDGIPASDCHSKSEDYRATAAIRGGFVEADTQFDILMLELAGLEDWAAPPEFVEQLVMEGPHWSTAELRLKTIELERAELEDGVIQVLAGVDGKMGSSGVDLRRNVLFNLEMSSPTDWRSLTDAWVPALRQLLSLLLVAPVPIVRMKVRPVGSPRSERALELVREWREIKNPTARRQLDSDALFLRQALPVSFADLVQAWVTRREDIQKVVVPLSALLDAPFMFAEHRLLLSLTAAEAAQSLMGEHRDKPALEHKARVHAVTSACIEFGVDPETLQWAAAVLQTRNDKSLVTRLGDLLTISGDLGDEILASDPDFAKTACALRVPVTHTTASGSKKFDAETRHHVGEALAWLARFVVARKLGIPANDVVMAIQQNSDYQWTIKRLAAKV